MVALNFSIKPWTEVVAYANKHSLDIVLENGRFIGFMDRSVEIPKIFLEKERKRYDEKSN